MKAIPFTIVPNQIPRNEVDQWGDRPIHWKLEDTDKMKTKYRKILPADGLELILLKCPYHTKQSTNSMQSPWKFQWHFSHIHTPKKQQS